MTSVGVRLALTLRIFCAAALISLGFVQAPLASERSISVGELAGYVLPDGTLPELCITLPGGNGTGKLVKIKADTANGVSGHALLVRPADAGPFVNVAAGKIPLSGAEFVRSVLRSPGIGPRAPPFS